MAIITYEEEDGKLKRTHVKETLYELPVLLQQKKEASEALIRQQDFFEKQMQPFKEKIEQLDILIAECEKLNIIETAEIKEQISVPEKK